MPSFLTEPRGSSRRKKKRSREKASNSVQYRPSHCHRNQATQWNPEQWGRKEVVRYKVQEGKSQTGNA